MVEVFHGVVEDGVLHVQRRLPGVVVGADADRVVRVHVRGPVVGLDHLVEEEERGAGRQRRHRRGRQQQKKERGDRCREEAAEAQKGLLRT